MILISILFLFLAIVKLDDACSGITMNQDTIFIMDSSSYWTTAQWGQIKTFVSSVMGTMQSDATEYPIQLLGYGDASLGATNVYDITGSSWVSRSNASSALSGASQFVTSTTLSQPDVRELVKEAVTRLAARTSSRRRVVVLIAGEESALSICSGYYPRENNIFFHVITINDGSWYSNSYDCLATGRGSISNSIQTVSSTSGLSSLISNTQELVCPSNPIVQITEVKPQTGGTGPGFVEMYNFGRAINLATTSIQLQGLITQTLNPSLTWGQGEYLVIYDDFANVQCSTCSCSKTSTFCLNQNYVKCGSSSATYGTGIASCTWITGLEIDNWGVTLKLGGTTIDSITYGSGGYWPLADDDYSYEKKFAIWEGQYGSSWARSIDQYGTPGDAYVLTNGISGCATAQYPNFRTCDTNPLPVTCEGTIIDDTVGNSRVYYEIGLAPYDGHHRYTTQYCANAGSDGVNCQSSSIQVIGNQQVIPEDIRISTTLGVALYDSDSWYGTKSSFTYYSCSRVTLSPTSPPTQSPTFSTPTITTCNVAIDSPTDGLITVTWSENRGANAPPNGIQEYNIVLNDNNPITVAAGTSTRQVAWDYNTAIDTVVVGVVYEVNGLTYQSNTTCDETTVSPTTSPSRQPTGSPLPDQTGVPSVSPTPSPTYRDIDVTSCTITIIDGQADEATVAFTTDDYVADETADEDETLFILNHVGGSTITIFSFETSPVTKTFSPPLTSSSQVTLQALWYINDPINGLESGSSSVTLDCDIISSSPTKHPTAAPSNSPSKRPSDMPTPAPTNQPSRAPTLKPTFEAPPARDCFVNISSVYDATLNATLTQVDHTFQLVPFDTNGITTPLSTKIRYSFEYRGTTVERFQNSIEGSKCRDTSVSPCISGFTATLPFGQSWDHSIDHGAYPLLSVQYVTGISTVQQESAQTICNSATGFPTMSPTLNPTMTPTAAPINGLQYIYFEVDMCDMSPQLDNDRCGCTTYDDCAATGNYDFAPLQIVSETEDTPTVFNIRRTDSVYRYDIVLFYTIHAIDQSNAYINRRNFSEAARLYTQRVTNFTYEIPLESYPAVAQEQNNQGNPGLYTDDVQTPAYSDPLTRDRSWINQKFIYKKELITANLELGIYKENYQNTLKSTDYYLKSEIFLIELVNCSVIPNAAVARPGDITECQLVWPSSIFVGIDDADPVVPGKKKQVKNRSWQDWFWYVLIAIALFLLILGYFAYRWWVNNKMKEAEVEEEEDKIDEHFREIEEGFGNDLGDDNVGVNPLNTDVQRMKNQGKNVMGTDTGNQNTAIQDRAEVRVDKINFKQEFGPNQGNRY